MDFRGSADFQEWRKLAGHCFASPPEVEHVRETVPASDCRRLEALRHSLVKFASKDDRMGRNRDDRSIRLRCAWRRRAARACARSGERRAGLCQIDREPALRTGDHRTRSSARSRPAAWSRPTTAANGARSPGRARAALPSSPRSTPAGAFRPRAAPCGAARRAVPTTTMTTNRGRRTGLLRRARRYPYPYYRPYGYYRFRGYGYRYGGWRRRW